MFVRTYWNSAELSDEGKSVGIELQCNISQSKFMSRKRSRPLILFLTNIQSFFSSLTFGHKLDKSDGDDYDEDRLSTILKKNKNKKILILK